MAFNMFGPQGFTMGGGQQQQAQKPQAQAMPNMQANGGAVGVQGQPQIPSQQADFQFYQALFSILDTEKKNSLSGGQVFNFFLSSGVNKAVLADIWDLVKQNGVLVARGFMTAMKLITLAQNGISPVVNNLNTVQFVGPPRLRYPPNTRLLTPPGTIIKGQGQQGAQAQQAAHQKNASVAQVADPFSALNLGFKGPSNAASSGPVSKPAAPTWSADATQSGTLKSSQTSSPQMNGLVTTANYPTNMNIGATQGAVGVGATGGVVGASGGVAAVGGIGGGNQYGPSTMLKQMHVRQSTRTLAMAHGDPAAESGDDVPALGRAQSRRLFEDERTREELRAANQREKMARQQLNDARISNEKLERENETYRQEIKDARDAQATALKQSSDALAQIQPLRLENEKLKQAINEWQDLIQNKDNEFEELAGECDDLRAQNETFKNETRDSREKLEDLTYQVDSLKTKLQESESENKKHFREISKLKDDKLKIESEKRDLDIEVVKLQSSVKSLQRELQKEKDAKTREKDMFGGFGNGYGPSSAGSDRSRKRRSTTEKAPSRGRSPQNKPATAPVDVMLGNSSKEDTKESGIGGGGGGDLFAGLSHDIPEPIKEEKPPKSDDEFGDSFQPSFPSFNDNNPPPPAGIDDGGRIDIGNKSIVPPGAGDMTSADANLTGYNSGGSIYDEIEVEDTVMEDYEVTEQKMVTVPKEVKYTEMGDVPVPVDAKDVQDGKYTGIGTFGESPYFLSLKIFTANQGHFVKSDKDKDGKLNVKEAWAFFQMANMDPKVLQQAWKLVATTHNDPDLPKDGLAEIQFHCMFQIILTMKRHQMSDCPNTIPDALNFDVIRMLGKPVNNGKVVVRKTIEKTRNEPAQEMRTVKVKKQRPVTKKIKKKVKRKGGSKQQPAAAKMNISPQMGAIGNNNPPPPADDGFGFGSDDLTSANGPGAASNGTNANVNSGGGDGFDDFGSGFDDFGTTDTKTKKSSKKADKNDGFVDDFGTTDPKTGATPGGDWEDFGAW